MFVDIHYEVDSPLYVTTNLLYLNTQHMEWATGTKKKHGKPTNILYNMFSIPHSLRFMSSHTSHFPSEQ
jgi:hypothetical protein